MPELVPGSVPDKYVDAVIEAGSQCQTITPPVVAAQIDDLTGFDQSYGGDEVDDITDIDFTDEAGIAGLTKEQWEEYGEGLQWYRVTKPQEAIKAHGALMCDLVESIEALDHVSGKTLRLSLAAYLAGVPAVDDAGGVPTTPSVREYVTRILDSLTEFAPITDSPGKSPNADAAIAFAEEQLGEPYELGAEGPDSWDCSGLTMKAWAAAGVTLPRTSRAQAARLPEIRRAELEPGDLVYWGHGSVKSIYHVALYMGDGKIIHAPNHADTVEIQPIDYWIPPSYYTRGSPQ